MLRICSYTGNVSDGTGLCADAVFDPTLCTIRFFQICTSSTSSPHPRHDLLDSFLPLVSLLLLFLLTLGRFVLRILFFEAFVLLFETE